MWFPVSCFRNSIWYSVLLTQSNIKWLCAAPWVVGTINGFSSDNSSFFSLIGRGTGLPVTTCTCPTFTASLKMNMHFLSFLVCIKRNPHPEDGSSTCIKWIPAVFYNNCPGYRNCPVLFMVILSFLKHSAFQNFFYCYKPKKSFQSETIDSLPSVPSLVVANPVLLIPPYLSESTEAKAQSSWFSHELMATIPTTVFEPQLSQLEAGSLTSITKF